MAAGDCLNGPSERLVELAERLVGLIPHADWALFCKNGTDATTTCVTLARAASGKRKILVAEGAYHGAIPWCTPDPMGVTPEDRAHMLTFNYNDVGSLESAVQRAGDDLAGIVVSAFKHDFGKDQEMPDRRLRAPRARALRRQRRGADRRRRARGLPPHAARQLGPGRRAARPQRLEQGDRQRPCAGRRHRQRPVPRGRVASSTSPARSGAAPCRWRRRSRRSTCWRASTGPSACARWASGCATASRPSRREFGIGVRQSGPPQMPTVLFDDDPDCEKGIASRCEALKRGVYLHPWHNMFLSTAHTEADIDFALEATRAGFKALASR